MHLSAATLHLPTHPNFLALATRHTVAVDPNSNLPGTAQLTSLVGGLMTWVLLACVAAVLAGAAAWGFGARTGHFGAKAFQDRRQRQHPGAADAAEEPGMGGEVGAIGHGRVRMS